jgi:hypothetical protein
MRARHGFAVGDRGVCATLVNFEPAERPTRYLCLPATALLAGLEGDAANGEVEATTLVLFCLGFFASRLPRCCFWAIGFLSAGHAGPRGIRGAGP